MKNNLLVPQKLLMGKCSIEIDGVKITITSLAAIITVFDDEGGFIGPMESLLNVIKKGSEDNQSWHLDNPKVAMMSYIKCPEEFNTHREFIWWLTQLEKHHNSEVKYHLLNSHPKILNEEEPTIEFSEDEYRCKYPEIYAPLNATKNTVSSSSESNIELEFVNNIKLLDYYSIEIIKSINNKDVKMFEAMRKLQSRQLEKVSLLLQHFKQIVE